jgi:hypothetical protein
MSYTRSSLKAYYSGTPIRTGYVLVVTDHHWIDNGFSLPKLDDYFLDIFNQIISTICTFEETGDSFVVHYLDRRDIDDNPSVELMIFCWGVNVGRLMNLRTTDHTFIQRTIAQFKNLYKRNSMQMVGTSPAKIVNVCLFKIT